MEALFFENPDLGGEHDYARPRKKFLKCLITNSWDHRKSNEEV